MAGRRVLAGVCAAALVVGAAVHPAPVAAVDEIPVLTLPADDGDGRTRGWFVDEAGRVLGTIDDLWVAMWSPDLVPALAPVAEGSTPLALGDDGTALVVTARADHDVATWWNPTTGRLDAADLPGRAAAGNGRGQVVVVDAISTAVREPDGTLTPVAAAAATDADISDTGWVALTTDDGATTTAWRWSSATGLERLADGVVALGVNDDGTVLTRTDDLLGATVETWVVGGGRSTAVALGGAESLDDAEIGPTGAVSAVTTEATSPPPSLVRTSRVVLWSPTAGLQTIRRVTDRLPVANLTASAPNRSEEVAVGGLTASGLWTAGAVVPTDASIRPADLSDRGQVTGEALTWTDPVISDVRGFVTPPRRGDARTTTTTAAPTTTLATTATATPAAVAPRFTG